MNDKIEFHELANLFPMMDGEDWEAFKKDVAENGVLLPVTLYEGKILDGRNRYTAAEEVGIECRFENYSGDSPAGFVVSRNLRMRHLNESQRAKIAAKLAKLCNGQHAKKQAGSIDPPSVAPAVSLEKAADMLNVGRATVVRAKKVEKEASPEVNKAVDEGKMSLNAALKTIPKKEEPPVESNNVVKLPVEKQEPLTKKQVDIRRTKEYQQLKRSYDEVVKLHTKLELELRRVIDENTLLKRKLETINGSTSNAR